MEFIKRVARNYWVAYYLVYVVGVAIGFGRYRQQLSGEESVLWLAAIFGASAGLALLVAILLEVIGRMVLLIPAAWNKAKAEGRAEGRKAERQRIFETLSRLGAREDGSIQITLTPEVIKLLMGDTDTP